MGRWAMYRRRGTGVAPSGGATVLVSDVALASAISATWTFDRAIATAPIDWNELLVASGAPLGIDAGGNPGDNFVTLEYGSVLPDDPWEITVHPTGLTFVGGTTLVLPQSGNVAV